MMIGNSERFAVDWKITKIVDEWVFGNLVFLVNGTVIGNPEDFSVDIKGCLAWIKTFLRDEKNRFERDLYDMEKNQVFMKLAVSVLNDEDPNGFVHEVYEDTFSRFHISHLGMSSFDEVTLLLVKSHNGKERCVWKTSNNEILDAYFEAGEIEEVLHKLVIAMESSLPKI